MLTVLMVYHLFGMVFLLKIGGIIAFGLSILVLLASPKCLDEISTKTRRYVLWSDIIDFAVALNMYYMWGPA